MHLVHREAVKAYLTCDLRKGRTGIRYASEHRLQELRASVNAPKVGLVPNALLVCNITIHQRAVNADCHTNVNQIQEHAAKK